MKNYIFLLLVLANNLYSQDFNSLGRIFINNIPVSYTEIKYTDKHGSLNKVYTNRFGEFNLYNCSPKTTLYVTPSFFSKERQITYSKSQSNYYIEENYEKYKEKELRREINKTLKKHNDDWKFKNGDEKFKDYVAFRKYLFLIYLIKYPNGKKDKYYKKILQAHILEFLTEIDSYDFNKNYLNIFNDGPNHQEIKSQTELMLISKSSTRKELKSYFDTYPKGNHNLFALQKFSTLQNSIPSEALGNIKELRVFTDDSIKIEKVKKFILPKYLLNSKATYSQYNALIYAFPSQTERIENFYLANENLLENKLKAYSKYILIFRENGSLFNKRKAYIKTEKKDFEKALEKNSIKEYNIYINKYSSEVSSENLQKAKENLQKVKEIKKAQEFDSIISKESRRSIQEYIDKNPSSSYAKRLKNKLASFPRYSKNIENSYFVQTEKGWVKTPYPRNKVMKVVFEAEPLTKKEKEYKYVYILEEKRKGKWSPNFGENFENVYFFYPSNRHSMSFKIDTLLKNNVRLKEFMIFQYREDKSTIDEIKNYLRKYYDDLSLAEKLKFVSNVSFFEFTTKVFGKQKSTFNSKERTELINKVFYKNYENKKYNSLAYIENYSPKKLKLKYSPYYGFDDVYNKKYKYIQGKIFLKDISYRLSSNVYYNTKIIPSYNEVYFEKETVLFGKDRYRAVINKGHDLNYRTNYTMIVKIKNTSKKTYKFKLETFAKIESYGTKSGLGGIVADLGRKMYSLGDKFQSRGKIITLKPNETKFITFKGKCEGIQDAHINVTPIKI
ncbi:hypothetical protein [Tenacibaculum xiamenense]|uniref:hypothetical protein n=1 Tax=Tenacibaculum xiamenense TaxID=1261553 RepID=UPI0038932AE1